MQPDLFTEDCRYGLAYSGDPPQCLMVPPEDEDAAPARRQRTPAGRQ
jgi:hypothetical protein